MSLSLLVITTDIPPTGGTILSRGTTGAAHAGLTWSSDWLLCHMISKKSAPKVIESTVRVIFIWLIWSVSGV